MDDLALKEKAKYDEVWTYNAYKLVSHGLRLSSKAIELCRHHKAGSILDAGFGSGRATLKFQKEGLAAVGVDITLNGLTEETERLPAFHEVCLWDFPTWFPKFGCVYCVDVMEHIPVDKVPIVINELADRCTKIAIFQIALYHDRFGPSLINEKLHLTVRPKQWWLERITKRFKNVRELEDEKGMFTFVCEVI